MLEEECSSKFTISTERSDSFEVMDLCEYYNKILGISVCSDFSNEEVMTDKSLYRAS